MKRYYFILFLSAFALFFSSCEKDEKFATKKLSDGTILFSVDPKALTGGSLVGVVQPSFDITSARFSKANAASQNFFAGNAVINVTLSPELSSLTVNLVVTATGVREVKGTFSGGVWTAPLNTLGLGGTNPANNSSLVLEFVATNADGSKRTARMFTVTVLA